MRPALTIGMAAFNDFNGVYFTVQALRMYHDLHDVELIVVDNNPSSSEGQAIKTLIENYAHYWTAGARYIPYTEKTGTSAPRQKVFEEASGEAVMCLDSHVLLSTGSIFRLLAYYNNNPDSMDLLSGPMLYDSLVGYESQFDDQWRAEMWGVWGHNPAAALPVTPQWASASTPHLSPGNPVPPYAWDVYDDAPPFEIPAMGLGLFSCRKDAWLGFNPNFSGFGGEEFYIHNKFRQAGRKCLCLPFLRWLHRFPRPTGIQYPLTRWQKIRNYVIGHQELGIPLDRVYNHFVKPLPSPVGGPTISLFKEEDWAYLLEDPIGHTQPKSGCQGCNSPAAPVVVPHSDLPQPPEGFNIDQMFENIRAVPRGLDQHMQKLRELARKSDRVVEFSQKRESTLALLAGRPKIFFSNNREQDALIARLHVELAKIPSEIRETAHFTSGDAGRSLEVDIPECDLLYLDTIYTGQQLLAELEKYSPRVKKYIAILATEKYGEVGAHNGPGLLSGLREFFKRNSSWRVVYHSNEQDGLTVISCLPEDAPALPSTPQMALNYAGFLTKHLLSGAGMAREETAKIRLDTCSTCIFRTQDPKHPELPRCSKCGCFLCETPDGRPGKALFASAHCPLDFWKTAESLGHAIIPQGGRPVKT